MLVTITYRFKKIDLYNNFKTFCKSNDVAAISANRFTGFIKKIAANTNLEINEKRINGERYILVELAETTFDANLANLYPMSMTNSKKLLDQLIEQYRQYLNGPAKLFTEVPVPAAIPQQPNSPSIAFFELPSHRP